MILTVIDCITLEVTWLVLIPLLRSMILTSHKFRERWTKMAILLVLIPLLRSMILTSGGIGVPPGLGVP